MAKIFIYLFTAMLHDVTITSLLCLCIICYKTEVPDSFVNRSTSVKTLWFQSVSRMGKTNMIFIDPDTKVNSIMRGPRTLKGSKDPYIFLDSLGRPEVMICDVTGVPPGMER